MRLRHRRAHLRAWLALALVIPAILVLALAMAGGPPDEAPRRLAEPAGRA